MKSARNLEHSPSERARVKQPEEQVWSLWGKRPALSRERRGSDRYGAMITCWLLQNGGYDVFAAVSSISLTRTSPGTA